MLNSASFIDTEIKSYKVVYRKSTLSHGYIRWETYLRRDKILEFCRGYEPVQKHSEYCRDESH